MCNLRSTQLPTDRHAHLSSPLNIHLHTPFSRTVRHVCAACVGREVILSLQGFSAYEVLPEGATVPGAIHTHKEYKVM